MANKNDMLNKYDPKKLSQGDLKEILINSEDMDKEVLLSFMKQVPNFTDLIKSVTQNTADLAKKMYESNESSQNKVLDMLDKYCNHIYKMCDMEELTFEQIKELLDRVEKILDIAKEKDSENKSTLGGFFDKYGKIVAGVAITVVGAIAFLAGKKNGSQA